jgi:hypothetical protein
MKWGCFKDTNEIQRITRGYFENLYPNKSENLKEMDTFLDACDLTNLNHLKQIYNEEGD